ncbi:prion-like-(Q/N-rich) domain-bearing protein 25 isoform X1 [Microplitis mediator]|uniref:prion-like-(Q/N-rich) domain-bearing protein 25 isoform X1 n=2 Tax=Microplitis mediator TaxID=375433 RepID=UPI002554B195|nr:prion-like-(Q/N-rich) domain-bearing protein 25 isoform X1 [Microplitis mediator]
MCNPEHPKPCCDQSNICMEKSDGIFKCIYKGYLGMFCKSDEDCNTVWHAKCSTGNICVCRSNYIQINNLICAPLLGEYCMDNEQCAPENSVCRNNECQCKAHYSKELNNFCKPSVLGELCFNDDFCKLVKFSKCSTTDFVCICTSNTIAVNQTCKSLLDGFCEEDEECVPKYSVCINNKCKCNSFFLPSLNTQCTEAYIGMTCKRDVDCSQFINHSVCDSHICSCNYGYFPINYTICAPTYNSFCQTNELCANDNSVCINNKCQCKPNYVYRDWECVPTLLNDPCNDDSNCRKIKNAICSVDKKCVCRNNFNKINEKSCGSILDEICLTNKQCAIKNSYCLNNRCQCRFNFVPVSSKQCAPMSLKRNCECHHDCHNIKNSKCSKNRMCICNPNYVAVNNVCAPILNGFCSTGEVCATTNTICIDNRCKCKPNYQLQPNNDCIPVHLQGSCKLDSDCRLIENSKCSEKKKCICDVSYVKKNETYCQLWSDFFCLAGNCSVTQTVCNSDEDCSEKINTRCWKNQCVCNNNYVMVNNVCLAYLNEFCQIDEDCVVENSICISNRCQCKPNYAIRSINHCEPISLGMPCKSAMSCSLIKNSICSKDKICICDYNLLAENELMCKPMIDEFCLIDEHCSVANLRCFDNKCQCQENYSPASDSQCVETSMLPNCHERTDCNDPLRTDCSENNKCVCKSNHIASINSTCLPLLDGFCWKSSQCSIENSVCIDNSCQCKPHFLRVSKNLCVQSDFNNQ